MPGKAEVLRQYRIPRRTEDQVASFTEQALRRIAGATIRRELVRLGYSDRRVNLTDSSLNASIRDFSRQAARSVRVTTNTQLARAISRTPDTGDPAQAAQRFLRSAATYNREALVPFQNASAQSIARGAFYQQNGIAATYSLVPADSSSPDTEVCQRAIEASPMSQAQADGYGRPPFHTRCPHGWQIDADPGTLPDESTLWTG